jgi:hypothetical protein
MIILARVLREGYGPGAWHGADMKAAIADVAAGDAFRRPAAGRHNIAELALHHAYYVREVRSRLTGATLEPFVLEGNDFFELDNASVLSWEKITATLADEQQRLAAVVDDERKIEGKTDDEKLDLVLGITCHAVYHAGQIQLIKKLIA